LYQSQSREVPAEKKKKYGVEKRCLVNLRRLLERGAKLWWVRRTLLHAGEAGEGSQ
jgi:hypothetical protein